MNTVVHEIVAMHTNRPESVNFLNAEIIEYQSQAEKIAGSSYWNNEDKKYIKEKTIDEAHYKLSAKYADIEYLESELNEALQKILSRLPNCTNHQYL